MSLTDTERPVHGGKTISRTRQTRYNTASNPPQDLQKVLKELGRKQSRFGYATKADAMSRCGRACREYQEAGPGDDLFRFLKETGILLHEGSLHDNWFVDSERCEVVLEACEKGQRLEPYDSRKTVERLCEILKERGIEIDDSNEQVEAAVEAAARDVQDELHVTAQIDLFVEVELIRALSDEELKDFETRTRAHIDAAQRQLDAAGAELERRADLAKQRLKLQEEISAAEGELVAAGAAATDLKSRIEESEKRAAVWRKDLRDANARESAVQKKLQELSSALEALED